MSKKDSLPFPEIGTFRVFVGTSANSLCMLTGCDSLDVALSVALNLHHLMNLTHLIIVRDLAGTELVRLLRDKDVPLKLQSANGR